MVLNEKNSEPLYKQLVRVIQDDINTGKYPEGSRLPSEADFSTLYNVSRITVRSALKALSEQGVVVRKQGKGTFVEPRKLKRNLSLATSFTQACREMGKTAGAKLVSSGLKDATDSDRVALDLPEGAQVVYLQRLRYVDGVPISVEEDRFPMRYAFLLNEDLNDASLLELLNKKYDITFYNVHRTIELVYAPHHIAKLLDCPAKTPMMYIISSGLEEKSNSPGQRSLQYIIGENFKLYI